MTATKLIQSIIQKLSGTLPERVTLYSAASTDEIVLPAVVVSASLNADPAVRGNSRAEVEFKVLLSFEEYTADGAAELADAIHAALNELDADALNEAELCHVYFWRWDSTTPFSAEGSDLSVSFNYATKFSV